MKILLLHTMGGGIGYYRFFTPGAALARAGHSVTYQPAEASMFHVLIRSHGSFDKWLESEGHKYDVVHMGYTTQMDQITIMSGAFRNWARQVHNREIPLLIDSDDDFNSVPSYNTSYKHYLRSADEHKTLMIQLRSADAVTVTTPTLAKSLRRDCKHIDILPNYCNPPEWDKLPIDPNRADDKSIRIFFASGLGRYNDLTQAQDAIEYVMRTYDGKEGRKRATIFFGNCMPDWAEPWISDRRDALNNRCFYIQSAPSSTYWKVLRYIQPDIFLGPVEENEFNKSKSHIKAFDAACAKSVFLCSDFPTYEGVPDECAVKCSTSVQWRESLSALIEDGGLRERKIKALNDWVLESQGIDQHINKWVSAYESALSRPVVSKIEDIIPPPIITEH